MVKKGKQLGSDEKPVMFRKTIAGKGSRSRPSNVSKKIFDENWDKIFNTGK